MLTVLAREEASTPHKKAYTHRTRKRRRVNGVWYSVADPYRYFLTVVAIPELSSP